MDLLSREEHTEHITSWFYLGKIYHSRYLKAWMEDPKIHIWVRYYVENVYFIKSESHLYEKYSKITYIKSKYFSD